MSKALGDFATNNGIRYLESAERALEEMEKKDFDYNSGTIPEQVGALRAHIMLARSDVRRALIWLRPNSEVQP